MTQGLGKSVFAWLVSAVLCALSTSAWAAEHRLALVIGNSSYQDSPLANPLNDATDMASALETLGFDVLLHTNEDRRGMGRAIREFGRQLKEKKGVGLFYYAGHGMQLDNRNYLIPVDTPMEEEDEVPFESIDVGSVLAKMESAGNALNLLILDACRNNPFPTRFRSQSRGLARVDAPVGSLVVYATAPGAVAADGDGRNGVFTGALLEQLTTPGLSLTETIRRTRAAVVRATDGKQVPWESSSLLEDYHFLPVESIASNSSAMTEEPPELAARGGGKLAIAETTAGTNALTDTDLAGTADTSISNPAVALLDSDNTVTQASVEGNQEQVGERKAVAAEADATVSLALLETESTPVRPEPRAQSMATLTVHTEPANARVRIMNIVEKYAHGISLDPSRRYDVYVTHPGYVPYREDIALVDQNTELQVVLQAKKLVPPPVLNLPAGSFTQGCSAGDRLCSSYEKPAHTVALPAFSMMPTEVTVAQFRDFVNETGYRTDAEKNAGGYAGCFIWTDDGGISRSSARWAWKAGTHWKNPGFEQRDTHPVTCVSWNDASAYASWISSKTGRDYTLPTESEWEFAARAGQQGAYGNGLKATALCSLANVADRTLSPTGSKWSERIGCNDNHWFSAPVSSFQANAFGLHDMQGNVWEWVQDVWSPDYRSTPRDGSANLSGKQQVRVLRGGGWDGDEKRVRLSMRSKADITSRAAMTGFRLVVR